MAYTPGDKYVTPIGIGLFDRIFGGNTKGGPYDNGTPNPGTMFGDDPFAAPSQAWARQMFGMGVAPETPELTWARQGANNRFLGNGVPDPVTGLSQGGWADRWDHWFNKELIGPDGRELFSPYKMTGLRVGQDYGVDRDAQGQVTDPWHSEMFQAALGIRNNLNQDRWLDPLNAMSGLRDVQRGQAGSMPDTGDYLSVMRDATGGPGAADFYGRRGVGQTNDLASANLRRLSRSIDREAEEGLAMRLPEISNAMEAAGLGRSGAGQLQMLQAQKDILSQANRDKQRVMADYTDREANRRAAAINLGSQIGAQGYGQFAQQMGQAGLAGLGDVFQAGQANRQNEQALFSQMMQQRLAKNQGDQNALYQMLGQAGQFGLGQLDAERLGQSQALADYMGLVNQREAWRGASLNEMLGMADRSRSIQQDILNQQMQAGFMPLDLITRLTTGISGSNYTPQSSAPWWASALSGVGDGVGKGVGEGAGSWLSKQFGNP